MTTTTAPIALNYGLYTPPSTSEVPRPSWTTPEIQTRSAQGSHRLLSGSLRRGKWTTEEEAFAAATIQYFVAGVLPLQYGTTLRGYLAQILHCDPMRVSKKLVPGMVFVGVRIDPKMGRRAYYPSSIDSPQLRWQKRQAEAHLQRLRTAFIQSIEREEQNQLLAERSSGASPVNTPGNSPSSRGRKRERDDEMTAAAAAWHQHQYQYQDQDQHATAFDDSRIEPHTSHARTRTRSLPSFTDLLTYPQSPHGMEPQGFTGFPAASSPPRQLQAQPQLQPPTVLPLRVHTAVTIRSSMDASFPHSPIPSASHLLPALRVSLTRTSLE